MSSAKKPAPKCANCDNVKVAIDSINMAMRRKGLSLGDMWHAVNMLVDQAVTETILRLRAAGESIRVIARTVHMDDGRVSQIIKAEKAKQQCCHKPCKPCKPAKPCKK